LPAVLEQGQTDDPERRIMGDTGASLAVQSAQHGLRVGDFPMANFVRHEGRVSYHPPGHGKLLSIDWW
jgi:hypothetical protein